jgi:hypothetical protein
MLLAAGTKIMLIHSKEEAVVTALLDDGMVMVRLLDSDLEIPVFGEDIRRLEQQSDKPARARIVPGKKETVPTPPARRPAESQYAILKSLGIQLAFAPIMKADGTTEKYEIYLLNDTPYPALFTFTLELNGRKAMQHNGKLISVSALPVGELWFDQLNDAPCCYIEAWRILTDGTGPRLEKELKIKPKQFFNKVKTAPILDRPVHLYRIFEKLTARSAQPTPEEDLKTYTQRARQPKSTGWLNVGDRISHEVREFAEFVPELDLHIDQLVPNPKKLNKASILRIQMQHFEAYIEKAIRLGVERVFIIHGVGEGRLRDRIAGELLQMPEVKTFKNEYHPRYGFGATEVIF